MKHVKKKKDNPIKENKETNRQRRNRLREKRLDEWEKLVKKKQKRATALRTGPPLPKDKLFSEVTISFALPLISYREDAGNE